MAFSKTYLLAYNSISLILWAYLTLYTVSTAPTLWAEGRLHHLYDALLFPLLAATQSLALVEVVHALSGLVRASPATTAIQVVGKNLVVWTVMVPFPEFIVGADGNGHIGAWGFLGCLVCWGLSEVIKYGYFVMLLSTGSIPSWLQWLRYSAFIPLYPPGFLSEAFLVYLALTQKASINPFYRAYLFAGFLSYIPASYIMYSYMLSQRRRTLKFRGTDKKN